MGKQLHTQLMEPLGLRFGFTVATFLLTVKTTISHAHQLYQITKCTMLFPKKVKHRKWQVGRKHPAKLQRPETRGITVAFGAYGLKATSQSRVRSNQIEAARRVISRTLGKTGKIWIRIFPDKPISKKPLEVRQGKGKGNVEYWVAQIQPGRMLYEMEGVSEEIAREAFRLAAAKLPIKTTFVSRTVL